MTSCRKWCINELIRNIAIIGHLHHGKTSLMDLFVRQTHKLDWTKEKYHKFTDTRFDERDRKISSRITNVIDSLQNIGKIISS